MPDDRPIDLIDNRHMMAVLLYLLENGQSNRTSIYNSISRNSNMPLKLERMVEMIFMDLTDRGRYIAEHLVLIERALGE